MQRRCAGRPGDVWGEKQGGQLRHARHQSPASAHVVCVANRQLRKQKKEHEQREFEALQEQGHNPYEVYRVRDAEAAAAHAAAQLACRQEQRKADIAAALAAEDRARKKLLAKQEYDRKVQQQRKCSTEQQIDAWSKQPLVDWSMPGSCQSCCCQ